MINNQASCNATKATADKKRIDEVVSLVGGVRKLRSVYLRAAQGGS